MTVDSVQTTGALDPAIISRCASEYIPEPMLAPGEQRVVVKFTLTTTGTQNATWSPDNPIVKVGAREYLQTSESRDATSAYNNHATRLSSVFIDGVNPGTTATTYGVWVIPGDKPTVLSIPVAAPGVEGTTPQTITIKAPSAS